MSLADGPDVLIDRRPKVAAAAGGNAALAVETVAAAGNEYRLDQPEVNALLDMQTLYLTVIDHKQRRGHDNLFIDKAAFPTLLERCKLRVDYPLSERKRLQTDAGMALCTYVDRYVARRERQSENTMLAPKKLSVEDAPGVYLLQPAYQIRIHEQALEKQIQKIVSSVKQFESAAGAPLPRLHIDQHLYHPLVNEAGMNEGISISPAPLKASEASLLETLTKWWANNHKRYSGVHLYLLRNLPRIGIGLYRQSGFYPDFILWLKHSKPVSQRIVLLEPHGLHHETPNALKSDKVQALAAFRELGKSDGFSKKKIMLDGYIISDTPVDQIPGGANGKSREVLATDHAVILAKADDDWWVKTALGL